MAIKTRNCAETPDDNGKDTLPDVPLAYMYSNTSILFFNSDILLRTEN